MVSASAACSKERLPTLTPTRGACDMGQQVFAGMLVGALVCGGMADTLGRKPVRAHPTPRCRVHPCSVARCRALRVLSETPRTRGTSDRKFN